MAHRMALAAQLLGQSPRALGGPAQGRLRVPPCGRFDQGSQGGEEGRVVPFDAMPTAARGPHALGRQVVLGPVRSLSQLTSARPDGSPGEACGFGDEAHATASQGLGLTSGPLTAEALGHQRLKQLILRPHRFHGTGLAHTSGPLTAEALGHQRLKQLILRPHRFHGTGLAHTTRRVQDTRRSQRNRSSYFLTVPSSSVTIGAGVTQHFWTNGHDKPLVFVRRLSQGHIGHGTCPNVSHLSGWVLARRHDCFVAVPLRCIHRAGRTISGTAAQVGQDDRLAIASDYLLARC